MAGLQHPNKQINLISISQVCTKHLTTMKRPSYRSSPIQRRLRASATLQHTAYSQYQNRIHSTSTLIKNHERKVQERRQMGLGITVLEDNEIKNNRTAPLKVRTPSSKTNSTTSSIGTTTSSRTINTRQRK